MKRFSTRSFMANGLLVLISSSGLALFCISASAETIVSVTQIRYDNNLRPICSVVRMDPAAFTSLPSDACAPAAAVGSNGPDRVTKTTYDAAGQVTAIQQAYATSDVRLYARYTYTPNGWKASETDANGNRTSFSYDGYGRLAVVFYPNTAVGSPSSNPSDYDQFTYDANGNRASWRRRNGQTITYTYDSLNREVIADVPAHPSGAYNATEKDIYTTYDLMGRIKKKAFASYTGTGVSYTYNAFGWIATTTDVNNRTISYLYNAAGARVQMTDASGYVINYDLDNLSRVKRAFLNGLTNVLYGYTYNNLGQRTLLSRGASGTGGTTTYAYDNLGRLQGLANDQATAGYDITWGKVGTVGAVAYNPANQITTWASNSTTFDYVETATAAENRTFDGLNRDAAVAAVSGGYDANGNLTKDAPRSFIYDIYNRLLTVSGGASNISLVYDPEGRLVKTTTAASSKDYVYDGTNLIAEYVTGATTPASRYIFGSGTDDPIVWLKGADDSDRRYYYSNYQGSIIGYTGSVGQFVTASLAKYGAYGEPRNSANAETWSGTRFGYTGQVMLPEAYLYYYKARVYDPKFGRFLQTDPVGSKDDLDLYAYVKGDPINNTDPTGMVLWPWEKRVTVVGGTPEQRKHYNEVVETVLSTSRGKELAHEIDGAWWQHGNPQTINLKPGIQYDTGAVFSRLSDGKLRSDNNINVDPNFHPPIQTSDGIVTPSDERIIGHELGHSVTGVTDSGPDQMNNVKKNENPIVTELGMSPRTQYQLPADPPENARKEHVR